MLLKKGDIQNLFINECARNNLDNSQQKKMLLKKGDIQNLFINECARNNLDKRDIER